MGWGFLAKGKVTNKNIDKMERKISIKGVQYTMKHCVRARMMHESISGKMWSLDTMSDQYIYFYSCILAGTKNVKLEFDEFLNIMDENPALLKEFQEFASDALKAEAAFLKPKKGDGSGKN